MVHRFTQAKPEAVLWRRTTRRRRPPRQRRLEPPSTGGSKISKKKSTVEVDSEDEDRGTSFYSSTRKFGDTADRQIHSLINSKALLPNEMLSLCNNMEKIIICSVSKQTWAKHNSALNLYREFCKFHIAYST